MQCHRAVSNRKTKSACVELTKVVGKLGGLHVTTKSSKVISLLREVQVMQEMMRLREGLRLLPHRKNIERLSKVSRAFFTAQKTMVSLNSSPGPWLSFLNLVYYPRTWVAAPGPYPASSVDLASSQSKIKHQVELLLIPRTFSLNPPHWSTSPPVTTAGPSLLRLCIPSLLFIPSSDASLLHGSSFLCPVRSTLLPLLDPLY